MAGSGGRNAVVTVLALAVIVGAGVWIGARTLYRPPAPPPAEHQWQCDKCGHLFRQPLPETGEPVEGEQVRLVDLLGGAAKCPECGEAAHCRPLLRCRTCGASFAATIALDGSGKPIALKCINPDCKRPLLAASPLPPEAEAKGRKLKCARCGRTFLLTEAPNSRAGHLLCPYTDHRAAAARPAD